MIDEKAKDNPVSWRFAAATLGVAGSAILAAAVIALAPGEAPKTYTEVTVKCEAPDLTRSFRNATVSGRETFAQWPVARPITVQERDTGHTTTFSGNNCVVLPKNQ